MSEIHTPKTYPNSEFNQLINSLTLIDYPIENYRNTWKHCCETAVNRYDFFSSIELRVI